MKKLFHITLLLAGLAWCVSAQAQVTAGTSYINKNSVSQTSGSVTMTTVDANSCVIVSVVTDDNASVNTIAAPTATGLTFNQISTTSRSANNFNIALFRAWTTSSLGSTTISGSWNQSNDWLMLATDFTGTAGTSGNNCSDAIGGTAIGTPGTSTSPTVTVTSTSHNNSKYFGVIVFGNSATRTITKGASYTNGSTSTWDGTWAGAFSEYSTSPVTPAANTAVNGTISAAITQEGIYAIELLVSTGAATAHTMPPAVY